MRTVDTEQHADERQRALALFSDDWMSTTEAAAFAGGVGDQTVRVWIKEKKLEAFNAGTEKRPNWRVRRDVLAAFIAARTVNAVDMAS